MLDDTRKGAAVSTGRRAMPSEILWRTPMLHLENLKKQAKQIVRWHREGYYPVAQRIRYVSDPVCLASTT
jgi:hypothetical protein